MNLETYNICIVVFLSIIDILKKIDLNEFSNACFIIWFFLLPIISYIKFKIKNKELENQIENLAYEFSQHCNNELPKR